MQVLPIDGFNLIRRIYEARPHDSDVVDKEVISSSTQSLTRALRFHKPSHVCCVFDSHEPTWRHELFPTYKANRKPTPAALLSAIPDFEAAFNKAGVSCMTIPHYEADDVIATLAKGISNNKGNVIILSTDKNFLQLLNNNVKVYDHFKEINYTFKWVQEKYGVNHEQLIDYWSLTGDSTNNIKGVPKIGPKTAQKLISTYQTLEELLKSTDEDKLVQRVKECRTEAEDARELTRLKTDIQLGINLNQFRYVPAKH